MVGNITSEMTVNGTMNKLITNADDDNCGLKLSSGCSEWRTKFQQATQTSNADPHFDHQPHRTPPRQSTTHRPPRQCLQFTSTVSIGACPPPAKALELHCINTQCIGHMSQEQGGPVNGCNAPPLWSIGTWRDVLSRGASLSDPHAEAVFFEVRTHRFL